MPTKIIRCKRYDVKVLRCLLSEAFDEFGVSPPSDVPTLLKPNIVIAAKPRSAIITHPAVVEATIRAFLENGVRKIIIGEGPGLGADERKFFTAAGYERLRRKYDVTLLNLNKAERVEVSWKYGTLKIPKIVVDAFYVNMPKLKTHGNTVVTLSIKNQKGLLLNADKKRFHLLGLHEPLVELLKVVKPDLVVVDGIVGMEGEGPLNGKRKKANVIVVSTDAVAADITCCRLMRIEPKNVEHLKMAIEQRLCGEPGGGAEPDVKDAEAVKASFKPPHESYGRLLNVYSWRNPYACSMCIDAFSLAIKSAFSRPKYWGTLLRFLYFAAFRRIDVIQGRHAKVPEGAQGILICLGNCTKDVTAENAVHVEGCPPDAESILGALRSAL